jgi:hypothetical protein
MYAVEVEDVRFILLRTERSYFQSSVAYDIGTIDG